jgi:hypothetical protein
MIIFGQKKIARGVLRKASFCFLTLTPLDLKARVKLQHLICIEIVQGDPFMTRARNRNCWQTLPENTTITIWTKMQVQISSTNLVSNINSYQWKLVRVTGTVYFFTYLHQVPGRELAPASTLHSQGQIEG